MKSKLNSLIFVVTLFFSNSMFAQNEMISTTALHPKTAQFALEVYQDVTEYQTPEHLAIYSKQISQVSIENVGSSATNYSTLQLVGLKNKYNPNLTFDQAGFDVSNFNPLKYHLDYHESEVQKFRIGTTDYIVIITPASN